MEPLSYSIQEYTYYTTVVDSFTTGPILIVSFHLMGNLSLSDVSGAQVEAELGNKNQVCFFVSAVQQLQRARFSP